MGDTTKKMSQKIPNFCGKYDLYVWLFVKFMFTHFEFLAFFPTEGGTRYFLVDGG